MQRWVLPRGVRYLLAGLVVGSVVLLSTVPPSGAGGSVVEGVPFGDKVGHVLMYAGLVTALAYALLHWDLPSWWEAGGIFVFAVLLGLALEGVQASLPYRSFSWGDAVANGVGASVVFAWYAVVPGLEERRVRV